MTGRGVEGGQATSCAGGDGGTAEVHEPRRTNDDDDDDGEDDRVSGSLQRYHQTTADSCLKS